MYLIFYGPEGSGKSTQADLLAKKLGIPHLVSGDLVRYYAKHDHGIIGRVCRRALEKGHYVPDSEMYVIWKHRLKNKDAQKGWILDGFPRNLRQAKFLNRKVEKYGHTINAVFYLKVSQPESIKRLLKRGRRNPDGVLHDSKERIKERLKRYYQAKKKVLEYYQNRGLLIKVNGEATVPAIHQEIVKKINQLSQNKPPVLH